MDIDFNNVRVQAIYSYNRLVEKFNKNIEDTIGGRKVLTIYADEITDDLNDLRADIGAIACTFKKDDPDFKCVYTDKIHMECFNEEE
jgi:hypothetical protein